jgi:hypothetical protein
MEAVSHAFGRGFSGQQELASNKTTYSNFLYFNLLIIEFNSNPSNNIMQFIQI